MCRREVSGIGAEMSEAPREKNNQQRSGSNRTQTRENRVAVQAGASRLRLVRDTDKSGRKAGDYRHGLPNIRQS